MFADLMAALVESCARASLVLCAAWALTSVMRRASASTRHFVWICAIAGSMLAPAMTAFGPRWTVSIPIPFASTQSLAPSAVQSSTIASAPEAAPTAAGDSDNVIPTLPSAAPAQSAATRFDLTLAALLLWAVGATMILAYAISGAIGAWWIRRSATVVEAPWVDEAQTLAEVFEIPGPVVVVESASVTMPIVCGVWRPSIVVPAEAAHWSDERRRVVCTARARAHQAARLPDAVAGAAGVRGVLVQPDRLARGPPDARRTRAGMRRLRARRWREGSRLRSSPARHREDGAASPAVSDRRARNGTAVTTRGATTGHPGSRNPAIVHALHACRVNRVRPPHRSAGRRSAPGEIFAHRGRIRVGKRDDVSHTCDGRRVASGDPAA